ncbi:hypothetical protein E8E14_000457 [Neopestalotiopsis sp. 37M]|nr:hypothetical protein E8E14_000457 [Neopestalotiopsis sp. 37M]
MSTSIESEQKMPQSDERCRFPIRYSYDYLQGVLPFIHRPELSLNHHLISDHLLHLAALSDGYHAPSQFRSNDAIDIRPVDLGLPWASGIQSCRQSKLWELSVDTARTALEKFSVSTEANLRSKTGDTIADISRKELQTGVEDGWAKFPVYMFSEGDEETTRLLSLTNVFIFVFDDFWEATDIEGFAQIQKAFISRMDPVHEHDAGVDRTDIQEIIETSVSDVLEMDRQNGNSNGREMISLMLRFFNRPAPPAKYHSLRDFLLYRHEDAAAPYVMACAKFAFNLRVDLNSPRLARYMRLFMDHISIANDLGSWAKEKDAFDTGKVLYLINTVFEVKNLLALDNYECAFQATQMLQFQVECEIDHELQALIQENILEADEWRFIDATLYAMSGNVLVSTIMSRYGGKETKLT